MLKPLAKSLYKRAKSAYHTHQAMKYFDQKTQNYLAIHKHLSPLPEPAKQEALAFWQPLLPKHRLKHTLSWHTIIYNSNRFCPSHPAYLDNAFYYLTLLPYLNTQGYAKALADKNYYDALFSTYNRPSTIARRINGSYYVLDSSKPDSLQSSALESTPNPLRHKIISQADFIQLVRSSTPCVIKPTRASETGSGSNIRLLESTLDKDALESLLRHYPSDFIVQDKIAQAPFLSALNPTSINTIRIVSLLYEGSFSIVSATLLVGEDGLTSNGGHFRIGIDMDSGLLRDFIIRGKGEPIAALPNAKDLSYKSTPIPSFKELLAMTRDMHSLLPHFGLIGWDFTLDSTNKPLFIEINPDVPSCEIPEQTNSPLFKDHLHIIKRAAAHSL